MKNLVLRLINAKISLPTFMWVLSSVIFAWFVMLHHDAIAASPFGQHLPVDAYIWAGALIVGDTTCLLGMIIRSAKYPIVYGGAMLSFLCWVFGSISILYTPDGWFSVLFLTGFYTFMYAYLFLGASLGVFRRDTPADPS